MTEQQKVTLKNIIEINEEQQGWRILIDYVLQLIDAPTEEKDKFVEEEYRRYPL